MSAAPTPRLDEPMSEIGGHEDLTMGLYTINVDDEVLQPQRSVACLLVGVVSPTSSESSPGIEAVIVWLLRE